MVASPFFMPTTPSEAGGETRTISLYHVHTKESLTVTYKVNGRYIPSAMSKINHLMRDWRRNETIKMDPETVDLMWELHADLGSNRPIHIICGFRSPKTNAFLKRIGRNVARKSQHMVGKAIDLYFPDVSTEQNPQQRAGPPRSAALAIIAVPADRRASSTSIPAMSGTGDRRSARRRWPGSCATIRRRSAPGSIART